MIRNMDQDYKSDLGLEPLDLHSCCRICLSQDKDELTNDMHVIDRTFQSDFNIVTGQNLALRTTLPYSVCVNCRQAFEAASKFRDAVINTQIHLYNYLMQPNNDFEQFGQKLKVIRAYVNVPEPVVKKKPPNETIVTLEIETLDNAFLQQQTEVDGENVETIVGDETIFAPIAKPKRQKLPRTNCPKCNLTNVTQLHLTLHASGPVPCDSKGCTQVCEDQVAYRAHKRVHRRMGTLASCDQCGEVVPTFRINDHKATHLSMEERQKTSKHKCHTCQKVFFKSNHLKVHINRVHLKSRNYQCEFCSKTFVFSDELRWHRAKKHLEQLAEEERPTLRCDCCNRLFLTAAALKCHTTFVKTGKAFRATSKLKGGNLKADNKSSSRDCEYCNLVFDTRQELAAHRREHMIYCDVCNKPFISKTLFDRHKAQHAGETYTRPYKCRFAGCTARFRKPFMLQVHNRFHTGERPYKCTMCAISFAAHADLVKHKRGVHQEQHEVVHRTEVGEFACSRCPQRFQFLSQLSRHNRKKHDKSPYYKCRWCEKSFAWSGMLRQHYTRCAERPTLDLESVKVFEADNVNVTDDQDDELLLVKDECIEIDNIVGEYTVGFGTEYLDDGVVLASP